MTLIWNSESVNAASCQVELHVQTNQLAAAAAEEAGADGANEANAAAAAEEEAGVDGANAAAAAAAAAVGLNCVSDSSPIPEQGHERREEGNWNSAGG